MRFPGQIETPYLRGLICILTSIIPQDAKQEMRQSTGSACGRGRGRGRGRGKRTVNTGNPIASTMVAPRRSRRMLERRDGNPMPPGPPGSQGSGTSAPGPPEPPKPMDGSGQYDSKESLPDPEKGTDASPGDAEDSPWSPPGSLVEDEADSGSDSDEEEGDNEYGEEGANIMEEEYPLDDVVDAGPILGNRSYDAIDKHCSPGHDEEIDPYQGNPSILNMDAFALRHAGQETSPPHQVNFVTLHSPTSSQEGQVCVNPSKFLSTKTSVEVMFVTD